MNKPQVKGHSIWLTPDRECGERLNQLIGTLAAYFSSPLFPPHLTLLGQLKDTPERILPVFKKLGQTCHPLMIRPESIGLESFYYRALFYKIEPSKQLLEMNHLARVQFERETDPVFFPHVSLLYSQEAEPTKRETLEELKINLIDSIKITGIELVKTSGEVENWERVEYIELV